MKIISQLVGKADRQCEDHRVSVCVVEGIRAYLLILLTGYHAEHIPAHPGLHNHALPAQVLALLLAELSEPHLTVREMRLDMAFCFFS